jgi:hypothetical protein
MEYNWKRSRRKNLRCHGHMGPVLKKRQTKQQGGIVNLKISAATKNCERLVVSTEIRQEMAVKPA